MTVRRVGPGPTPYRRDLGRVLVTTTDLDALVGLLKQSDPTTVLQLRFDGGNFDSSDDLKDLTDSELRTLRVVTDAVEVILNSDSAVAIGGQRSVDEVWDVWARPRQYKPGVDEYSIRKLKRLGAPECVHWIHDICDRSSRAGIR